MIRIRPARLALSSRVTPSQLQRAQMRDRISDACSPIPRCEYETVEPIQGRGQGADLARGAEYEQLYGLARVRIVAGEQRAHVA